MRMQHFQGHMVATVGVEGQVNIGKTAPAQPAVDAVRAEHKATRKLHQNKPPSLALCREWEHTNNRCMTLVTAPW